MEQLRALYSGKEAFKRSVVSYTRGKLVGGTNYTKRIDYLLEYMPYLPNIRKMFPWAKVNINWLTGSIQRQIKVTPYGIQIDLYPRSKACTFIIFNKVGKPVTYVQEAQRESVLGPRMIYWNKNSDQWYISVGKYCKVGSQVELVQYSWSKHGGIEISVVRSNFAYTAERMQQLKKAYSFQDAKRDVSVAWQVGAYRLPVMQLVNKGITWKHGNTVLKPICSLDN